MVGIPRSKGCKTCRRKKIKCDEQKPSCGQCRKGVRECEGYDQPTIFRHSTSGDFVGAPDSHCQSVIQFKSQSVGNITWVDGHEVQNDKPRVLQQKRSKKRAHPYAPARLERAQAQLARTAPLSHTPNPLVLAVQSITGQFLELCLPLSETQEAPLAWLGEIQEMGQDIDALPLAMSALALGWAGCVNDQPRLADTGLQLYNTAIQQLRNNMSTYSPLQSLVVTTIFVAFELCQFGSKGNPGWLTHMKGIAAFLQALGPEKVSMDPYLKIYSFCRVVFIMQGLNRRRSVCAGSHMWMHGPFRNRKKNAYHQFYDLSAEACELLGYADDLAQPDDRSHVKTKRPAEVLGQMLHLISRLGRWMQDSNIVGFSGPSRFPAVDLVTRHRLDRARARGYPTKLPPDSGWTSDALYWQRMMYNYWALRLDLYMTISDNPVLSSLLEDSEDLPALLMSELDARGPGKERAPTALIHEECRKLANNIAVNCTGACHSTYQNFGSLVTVYTLETAIRWYDRHNRDASEMDIELEQHCRAILGGIKTEESKGPCSFEVSIMTDEVLRRRWC
ncbi:hypothetical protein F4801DRAFT_421235 [Xylaria longipes]|nr:hypothetical protein F4801DRAFT_421235 [Xylaria longipes]RYC63367.1 hypothetical protein CHU98_g2850 [Xylaria longipes]